MSKYNIHFAVEFFDSTKEKEAMTTFEFRTFEPVFIKQVIRSELQETPQQNFIERFEMAIDKLEHQEGAADPSKHFVILFENDGQIIIKVVITEHEAESKKTTLIVKTSRKLDQPRKTDTFWSMISFVVWFLISLALYFLFRSLLSH